MNNFHRVLVFGIILLFVGIAITPVESIGIKKYLSPEIQLKESNSIDDGDTTPPITTHELDPPEPDGENGYYISNVTITLNATDDLSGVNVTYYLKDLDWKEYTGPFTVTSTYQHLIFYYSVDNAGNVEDIKQVEFKIDKKLPSITLFYERLPRRLRFIAICHDYISGIDRVEFCTVHGDLIYTDYDEPYEWTWYYNSQGSEVISYPLGPELGIMAVAYDKAGNSDYDVIEDISPYSTSISKITCGSSSQIIPQFSNPIFFQILQQLLNLR